MISLDLSLSMSGSRPSVQDPYTAWVLAVTASGGAAPSAGQTVLLQNFFTATAGIRSKIRRLFLFGLHDAIAARIDPWNPGTVATLIGTPVFTAYQGYSPNAVASTGLDLKIDVAQVPSVSLGMGLWMYSVDTTNVDDITSDHPSNPFLLRVTNTLYRAKLSSPNADFTADASTATGFRHAQRISGSQVKPYLANGSPGTTISSTSSDFTAAPANLKFGSATGATSARKASATWVTSGASDADVLTLRDALATLLPAFAAAA
jgi:hypothetical protein